VLNTDCGSSGTLVCDTSLKNGYCTQFNCTPDVCQNSAACVALETAPPGCPYDDYHAPSRTTRTFCLAQCHQNSDCRQSDGYACVDPRQPPYNAAIIDDVQSQLVCLPMFTPADDGGRPAPERPLPDGSVCSVSGPVLDASIPFLTPETGTPETGPDATSDALETGADAPNEAPADGPMDAEDGLSSGDGAGDTATDVAGDAGAADATDGG
jgi:hypothetical protein